MENIKYILNLNKKIKLEYKLNKRHRRISELIFRFNYISNSGITLTNKDRIFLKAIISNSLYYFCEKLKLKELIDLMASRNKIQSCDTSNDFILYFTKTEIIIIIKMLIMNIS